MDEELICCECGTTDKVKRFRHRNLCKHCIFWYDMDSIAEDYVDAEEFERETEDESDP